MRWIHPLSPAVEETADVLGAKARGLVDLRRLGLRVPPGFVIGTKACRVFLRDGRLPAGLDVELAAALADLEAAAGRRRFGGPERPLAVSVRSGAVVSMPGMMSTILGVGLTAEAAEGLAAETGDARFANDSRQRFLSSLAAATAGSDPAILGARDDAADRDAASGAVGPGVGPDVGPGVGPDVGPYVGLDAPRQLELAVVAVFSSWDSPRARTYRELHDIPHDLGTAATVQAMVYGNRDAHSGTGVAFSRDPNTAERVPYGEVLFGRQGDDVVSGGSLTRPLRELADREPAVWDCLVDALSRVEGHYRDVCCLEFTYEAGELWILQTRPGGLVGRAAVRAAVDLVDEGAIGRREALFRVSAADLEHARTPRIATAGAAAGARTGIGTGTGTGTGVEAGEGGGVTMFARGVGASAGVAVGRVATTADKAVRMAAQSSVILVRPQTSPLDMHGLAAAVGVVTGRGGPASHAAVVARAMGKPAVVGVADLTVDVDGAAVRVGGRTVSEGTLVTIDGTGGEVVIGSPRVLAAADDPYPRRLLGWADELSGTGADRGEVERLRAAHAVLRRDHGGRL